MGEANEQVTVLVSHRLKEGRESEFHAWLRSINETVRETAGFRRLDLVQQSSPSTHDVGAMVRFDNQRSLEEWHKSEAFRRYKGQLDRIVENVSYTEITGFEQWFVPPSPGSVVPSRLKQAAVILIGIYPLALVLPPVMNPIFTWLGLPGPLQALIFSVFMVALMTWAVMPLLNRALGRWLFPREQP